MSDKKPNIFRRFSQGIQNTVQETVGELRKVSWPSWTETKNLTLLVLAVIVVMGIFLGLMDYLDAQLFKLILGS